MYDYSKELMSWLHTQAQVSHTNRVSLVGLETVLLTAFYHIYKFMMGFVKEKRRESILPPGYTMSVKSQI